MTLTQRVLIGDARDTAGVPDGGAQLVVTSPPYPMIAMWDEAFRAMSPAAGAALDAGDGPAAFEAMHAALDPVWAAAARALSPGGFACVNIGDATRTIAGNFQLYPNHARIQAGLMRAGLTPLPDILWRKPTNAPNKFMGSGMLPAGAYVTYEHEYILIFRKGAKRAFRAKAQREARSRSAFFWEERNAWFSDLWTGLRGAAQRLPDRETRTRSAAFPFALAYRLINMYSVQGDLVLDPFLGTGTTLAAAAVAGRAGVGIERSASLLPAIRRAMAEVPRLGRVADARLAAHRAFVATRVAAGKPLKHHNDHYDFPVMTRQERSLVLLEPRAVREPAPGTFEVDCAATGPTPRGEGPPGEASR